MSILRIRPVSASLIIGFVSLAILVCEVGALSRRTRVMSATVADPAARQRPSVLFVFRPADCPSALDDIDRWNVLAKKNGVYVSGLMITDEQPKEILNELIRSYKIEFPVRPISPSDFVPKLASLGNPHLPMSIVLDERGAIRGVMPAGANRTTAPLKELLLASIESN
jgi:hypothetical protein